MYKSKYKTVDGLPLTETIPMLLEWRGISPQRLEELTEGGVKQANIHRICSGKTKNSGPDVVGPIAAFFGLTFSQIWEPDYVRKYIDSDGRKKDVSISTLVAAKAGITDKSGHSIIPDVQKDVVLGLGSEPNPKDEARALLSSLPDHEKMALIEDLTELLPIEDAAKAAVMFSARVLRDLGEPGA